MTRSSAYMASKKITFAEAIKMGLIEEMKKNKEVFLMGEDIEINVWSVTRGLIEEFGSNRVRSMPISENGFCAAAVGAAATGTKPVVEIMYSDFILVAADAICNQAAKLRYMSGDQFNCPVTFRIAGSGMGSGAGSHHSQSLEALPMHFPGLKIAFPSTPYDAKGLIKSAINDKNPVLFFEHKLLYSKKGEVPENEYYIPIGEGEIKKEGIDGTIVSYAHMLDICLEVSEEIYSEKGINLEVYDPRSLRPFDYETLYQSIEKTGKLIIVEEDTKIGGVGAEISAKVSEEKIFLLDSSITRIASEEVPIPSGKYGHSFVSPDKRRIKKEIIQVFQT
jgi:pyruvate dehydrogenase E1 component beta subunit